MKKILVILLSLMMVMSLVACGSGSIVGKYTLVELSMGEIKFDEKTIKESGMVQEMEFKADGTGIMTAQGESGTFTWKDGKITLEGGEMNYELKGDTISITSPSGEMVFKRK